ncbi:acyltransferase [Terrarubrum flagellatum]|uniref:acyltransferase family protein n=1 Tax=Terrirubrum flagellatum TaxID=2895980 RepID=UPI0031454558
MEPNAPDAPTRDVILSIQVMRGFAAIAVALYHTHLILAQPEYGGIDVFGAISSPGWLGVNFFFVLSGFIILHAHHADIGQPARVGRYAWKRFTRVYPVYWIFLSLFILAAFVGVGNAKFEWRFGNLLSAYALAELSDPLSLPLQVAWTLFYEVRFYALFALLILNRVAGVAAMVAWGAGIAIANIWFNPQPLGMFHMWNVYFLFGMSAFFFYRLVDARWGLAILVAGVLGLISCLSAGWVEARIAQISPLTLLALAVPFTMILLGGALAEKHASWRPSKLLLLLGEASYSIYLVHSAAITVMAILQHKLAPNLAPAPALYVATALASIAAGVAAHLLVEKPVLAATRLIGGREKRRIAALRPQDARSP